MQGMPAGRERPQCRAARGPRAAARAGRPPAPPRAPRPAPPGAPPLSWAPAAPPGPALGHAWLTSVPASSVVAARLFDIGTNVRVSAPGDLASVVAAPSAARFCAGVSTSVHASAPSSAASGVTTQDATWWYITVPARRCCAWSAASCRALPGPAPGVIAPGGNQLAGATSETQLSPIALLQNARNHLFRQVQELTVSYVGGQLAKSHTRDTSEPRCIAITCI